MKMARIGLAVLLLAATFGCNETKKVTQPENPAPPPGVDALITDSVEE